MKNKLFSTAVLLLVISILFSSCTELNILPTDFSTVTLTYENDLKRYYYNNLTENGKIAYTLILNSIRQHPEKIEIPDLSDDEFESVFYAVSYDNPDLLCLGKTSEIHSSGSKYYYVPDYEFDVTTCDKKTDDLNIAANNFVNSISQNTSEYEKELLIHDYICEKCSYVYNGDENIKASAYDALINGEAVCEGYARAAQLLLNKLNIVNYLICGDATDSTGKTDSHMWNIVTIDGKKYHLDLTWDDFDKEGTVISHSYFNVPDTEISANHFNLSPSNNNCISDEKNYFVVNGIVFSKYTKSVDSKIITTAVKNILAGTNNVEIKFSDINALNSAKKKLVDNSAIYNLFNDINKKSNHHFSNIMYSIDESMMTLQFSFD